MIDSDGYACFDHSQHLFAFQPLRHCGRSKNVPCRITSKKMTPKEHNMNRSSKCYDESFEIKSYIRLYN